MNIQTDTATIVIYDLDCLKHCLEDDCDWWSIPRKELKEINSGNVLFIGTGSDGVFEVNISDQLPQNEKILIQANIKNLSGTFFFGGGECVSGEELEPDEHDGNFIDYPKGVYCISAWISNGALMLHFAPIKTEAINEFTSSPRIA